MKIVTASLAALWLCLSFALPAHSADEFHGNWKLSKSRERGKVQFALTFRSASGGFSQHESDWSVTVFNVLDLATEGKHAVTFVIERDVGRIECNGFIEGGEGIGAFTFKLSRKYLDSMRSRGHGDADESEQFVMAVHDLSVDFARALKGENVYHSGAYKVVSFMPLAELRANA